MYIMNSMTSAVSYLARATTEPVLKWAQNDNLLSQGSSRQSLVMVIIVAIQLFVTVSVARSVIYFLLLTSGDVEQNPGPCQIGGTLACYLCLHVIKLHFILVLFLHVYCRSQMFSAKRKIFILAVFRIVCVLICGSYILTT